jgi:trehalose synthase
MRRFRSPYVAQHDAAVFSTPDFAQQLSIPQFMVAPSIDPLSDKNRELDENAVTNVFESHGIDRARPVLTQISRVDRLRDPLGGIAAYRIVNRRRDCQLVLAGGSATDDPEGALVLQEVREAAADDRDIHALLVPPFTDLEINALVRGSTIVFQKSTKEGFGLTVTEAPWAASGFRWSTVSQASWCTHSKGPRTARRSCWPTRHSAAGSGRTVASTSSRTSS